MADDEAISYNENSMLQGMRLLRGVYPERTGRARNDGVCPDPYCPLISAIFFLTAAAWGMFGSTSKALSKW